MGHPRKSIQWETAEEAVNLVKNTLHFTHDSEVEDAIGIARTNISNWRKAGKAPAWVPAACRGVVAEKSSEGRAIVTRTGFQFTTEQLELLNAALLSFTRMPDGGGRHEAARKLRSTVLLELAARLDG